MSALKPLTTLLECAERERDDARARFERARVAHQAASDQGNSLRAWRSEYAVRWQEQFKTGGSVEIVRCYQDFMGRLGQAIAEQDIAVERARTHLEASRSILQAREQRVGAVEQLISRRQREATLAEGRREQKATDELASRSRQGDSGRHGGMGTGLGWHGLSMNRSGLGGDVGDSERVTRPGDLEHHADFVPSTT